MKLKAGLYIGIAMVFIIGGSLLAVKGRMLLVRPRAGNKAYLRQSKRL